VGSFFVLANDDCTMSGTGKFGQTPRLNTDRLIEQKFAELEMLRHLLVVAQDRIARATPGPSFAAKNVRDLVRGLGKVVENTATADFNALLLLSLSSRQFAKSPIRRLEVVRLMKQ
jgi:hypothetical protein